MAITATIAGGAVQLTGNPVRVHCTGASVPTGASGYMILLKTISEDGKLEGAPFIDAIVPKGGIEAWFDISGRVDQPVKAVFQWPLSGAVKSYPTQAFNIQVQTGERYINADDNLVENWGETSSVFQMLKGGLSQRQVNVMNDAGYTFYSKYLLAGKFLTARPWGDYVHPLQAVKLWFMPIANGATTFNIKAVYSDATEASYSTAVTMNTDNLYEFNCNPKDFGITLEPAGKRVEFFDVWLGTISETRRFMFDWKPCERPVFLFFANTFGGVDDVYLSGYIKDKFMTEGTAGYRPPSRLDTVYEPTLISTDKSGQNKWEINTGWKPLATMQYLRDLLVSKQAWYLYSNSSQTTFSVIPIIVEPTEKLLLDRHNYIFSMDIEISEAHRSKHSFDNRAF